MGRRPRVQYSLDSGNIKKLPENEIKMILRAADELISTGGRNMLVKILKGSRDKKVLEHGLDKCPAYGFYHELTMEEISYRVDFMIEQDFLRISTMTGCRCWYFQKQDGQLRRPFMRRSFISGSVPG